MKYDNLPLKVYDYQINSGFSGFQGQIRYLPGMIEDENEKTSFIESESFLLIEMDPETQFNFAFDYPYTLLYVFSGRCRVDTVKGEYTIIQKDGCFADCRDIRSIHTDHKKCVLSLLFLRGILTRDLYQIYQEYAFLFKSFQFPEFEQRQYLILKNYYFGEKPKAFEFSCHMDHLLVKLIHAVYPQKYLDDNGRAQLMMRIMTYMEKNIQENLTVKQVADYFAISESHFRRIFTEKMQMPPKQYISELRIRRATHLLKSTDRPISEIGEECGFCNTNHFIQTFKKSTGITPKQYRKESDCTVTEKNDKIILQIGAEQKDDKINRTGYRRNTD